MRVQPFRVTDKNKSTILLVDGHESGLIWVDLFLSVTLISMAVEGAFFFI